MIFQKLRIFPSSGCKIRVKGAKNNFILRISDIRTVDVSDVLWILGRDKAFETSGQSELF